MVNTWCDFSWMTIAWMTKARILSLLYLLFWWLIWKWQVWKWPPCWKRNTMCCVLDASHGFLTRVTRKTFLVYKLLASWILCQCWSKRPRPQTRTNHKLAYKLNLVFSAWQWSCCFSLPSILHSPVYRPNWRKCSEGIAIFFCLCVQDCEKYSENFFFFAFLLQFPGLSLK